MAISKSGVIPTPNRVGIAEAYSQRPCRTEILSSTNENDKARVIKVIKAKGDNKILLVCQTYAVIWKNNTMKNPSLTDIFISKGMFCLHFWRRHVSYSGQCANSQMKLSPKPTKNRRSRTDNASISYSIHRLCTWTAIQAQGMLSSA